MIITDCVTAATVLQKKLVTSVISIGNPSATKMPQPPCKGFYEFEGPKLRLEFADSIPGDGFQEKWLATEIHIGEIIGFANTINERVLIHCFAGHGRSPAVGFITHCVWLGAGTDLEWDALNLTIRDCHDPAPTPNLHLVKLADQLLGREGKMVRTLEQWMSSGNGMYP
jgi:predicted protein tyrosine phosphatase